jgi:hypothetical protein
MCLIQSFRDLKNKCRDSDLALLNHYYPREDGLAWVWGAQEVARYSPHVSKKFAVADVPEELRAEIPFNVFTSDYTRNVPMFTSAVDSAISFVESILPGWDHGYERWDANNTTGKVWRRFRHDDTVVYGIGFNPSIALCIAAMTAKSAQA